MHYHDSGPILVTGGAGFIGSNFVRRLLGHGARVVNIDALTYAGNLCSLKGCETNPRYTFIQQDICDQSGLEAIFATFKPSSVVHFAAESHVDRSISGPAAFLRTNVTGTATLLEVSRAYLGQIDVSSRGRFRFIHVSTDEVYGSLTAKAPAFTESHPYEPNSPYSASKAASDHLVRAWYHTYGMPVITTNCSNNYGPYQFPEKLIPLMITRALNWEPMPIYGDGLNVRDWLYVEDHCEAIETVLRSGRIGQTYNIGGGAERTNLEIVYTICQLLDEAAPNPQGSYRELITHVTDRLGHDRRYAIDSSKIRAELGWLPKHSFETGIQKCVAWYLHNKPWWTQILDGSYRQEAAEPELEEALV